MASKKQILTAGGAIAAILGFLCALVVSVVFYGAMVYQLAGEDTAAAAQQTQAGGVLSLGAGTLLGENQTQETVGGTLCTVITRTYALEDGTQARAITASPAAYLERLSAPGVQMQLVTGFVIDGLDAVWAVSGDTGRLAAREGDTIYMIEAAGDQQTLYELGAAARRNAAE